MSLINQALRKAQRDRTPNHPGSEAHSQAPTTTSSNNKLGLIIGLVVAIALLIGIVVGLTVVVFKGEDPEPTSTQIATAPIQPEPTETAATSINPEISDSAAPVNPQTKSVEPTNPLNRQSASSVVEELRLAREAAEAKAAAEVEAAATRAAAEAKAAEEAAIRAAAKPSQEIINWLARAQVTGVKISDSRSRVILNGESYAVGEYVNFSLGLKVMIIQEKRILFIDENGKKYMKRI